MHIRFEEGKNQAYQLGNVDCNYRPRQSHWTETCVCVFFLYACVEEELNENLGPSPIMMIASRFYLTTFVRGLVCFFLHGCIEEGSFSDDSSCSCLLCFSFNSSRRSSVYGLRCMDTWISFATPYLHLSIFDTFTYPLAASNRNTLGANSSPLFFHLDHESWGVAGYPLSRFRHIYIRASSINRAIQRWGRLPSASDVWPSRACSGLLTYAGDLSPSLPLSKSKLNSSPSASKQALHIPGSPSPRLSIQSEADAAMPPGSRLRATQQRARIFSLRSSSAHT